MRMIGVVLVLALAVGASVARADDYADIMADTSPNQEVAVIVSGWQPVTGDIGDSERRQLLDNPDGIPAFQDQIMNAAANAKQIRRYRHLPFLALTTTAASVRSIKSSDPKVKIHRDSRNRAFLSDSTRLAGAVTAWNAGRTGQGQLVAVLDTGVDASHPFLAGRVAREACFRTTCPNGQTTQIGPGAAKAVDDHGIHVAGIVAGGGDRLSGVAPGARIVAINVFSGLGDQIFSMDSDILAGLDHVLQLRKDERLPIASANLSLGGGEYSAQPCAGSEFETAGSLLKQAGVAVIAASGNESQKQGLPSPACAESIYSVGAVDKSGGVADFSNSAGILDILAPGVDIVSSVSRSMNSEGFAPLSGTSMAAPHVAGAVAVLREVNPTASVDQIMAMLKRAGHPVTDPANHVVTPTLDLGAALGGSAAPGPTPQPAPSRPAPAPAPEPPPYQPSPPPSSGGESGWGAITN